MRMFILGALLFCSLALFLGEAQASDREFTVTNHKPAYTACINAVLPRMKSPYSTVFQPMDGASLLTDDTIYVSVVFDSANSYGAMLRGKAVCLGTVANPQVILMP